MWTELLPSRLRSPHSRVFLGAWLLVPPLLCSAAAQPDGWAQRPSQKPPGYKKSKDRDMDSVVVKSLPNRSLKTALPIYIPLATQPDWVVLLATQTGPASVAVHARPHRSLAAVSPVYIPIAFQPDWAQLTTATHITTGRDSVRAIAHPLRSLGAIPNVYIPIALQPDWNAVSAIAPSHPQTSIPAPRNLSSPLLVYITTAECGYKDTVASPVPAHTKTLTTKTLPARQFGQTVGVSLAPLNVWISPARATLTGHLPAREPEVAFGSDTLPADPFSLPVLGQRDSFRRVIEGWQSGKPVRAQELVDAIPVLGTPEAAGLKAMDLYHLTHALTFLYGDKAMGPLYARTVNDIITETQKDKTGITDTMYRTALRRLGRPIMFVVEDYATAEKLFSTLTTLENYGSFEYRQARYLYAETCYFRGIKSNDKVLREQSLTEALTILQEIDGKRWGDMNAGEKGDVAYAIGTTLRKLNRIPDARPYFTRAAHIEGEYYTADAKYRFLEYMVEDGNRAEAYKLYKTWKPKLDSHWAVAIMFEKDEAEERDDR